ncbi:MAG: hypothetical protein GWN00_32565 [Aliifodinibius sp.]|nr:hypothetical protein [Fodinibius sp.]NIV15505.1 hypothetical protein [Fodinibius sp.]NIY29351.1 hypothetical protein [Fodinibius sp.]
MFAIYTFVSTVALSLYPEEWMFVSEYLLFPFEWSIIARFLNFIIAALALTGVAILFFFFNWMGGLQGLDAEYKNYIRKFGGGVALGCTILQTLFLLWFLLVIPEFAKSFAVYFIGAFGALLLLVICIHLYYWLVDANKNYGTRLFVMFIVFFLLVSVDENLARDNSLQYQIYALEKLDMEIQSEIEAEREAKAGAEKEATVELGEEIYNQKCTACHQFDQRVVGPPYNSVLPKYEEDLEALKEFILNPVKVNPDYPAMPNQGLKPHEAEAAAKYLIQRYNELKQ